MSRKDVKCMILTDELLQSYCNGCQSIWAEGTGKVKNAK